MGHDMNPQSSEYKSVSQSIKQAVQDTATQNHLKFLSLEVPEKIQSLKGRSREKWLRS